MGSEPLDPESQTNKVAIFICVICGQEYPILGHHVCPPRVLAGKRLLDVDRDTIRTPTYLERLKDGFNLLRED